MEQTRLARELLAIFYECGLNEQDLSLGDLLDCLASAQLKLVRLADGEENVASLAYFEWVQSVGPAKL